MLSKKPIIILIFSLVAFATFSSSISSSFHFDDFNNISDNPDIKIKDLSISSLKRAAFTDVEAGFRPIPYLSFALNYYFSGFDTTSYHILNILLHTLSAFVIYLIILLVFDYDTADDEKKEKLVWSAFLAALYWLVTPFNSQAVIYIVQRMTLMMTLFFLLSFLYYVKGRKTNKKFFILSGFFFLLSFFSKQNALVFPLVIVLYELIFKRGGNLANISRNEKVIIVLLIIIILLPIILFIEDIHRLILDSGQTWGFTYYERELTQFRVLVLYFSLIIVPLPSRLQLLHEIQKSTSLFSPVTTIFSIIFVVGLFVFSILTIKKSPYFSFALLWFFITMSVEAVLPLEMMYEHRLYLPSIFLVGAVVNYATEHVYDKSSRILISAFCVIVIVSGALTGIRGKTWESEISLWTDEVNKKPESPRAHYHLGNSYQRISQYSKAEHHLTLAINKWTTQKHSPKIGIASAYCNLGIMQVELGRQNQAVTSFLKALEYKDDWYLPYFNLGYIYLNSGGYKTASDYLKKAVEFYPEDVNSNYNLGVSFYLLNDYDNALKAYKEAIRLNSAYVPAYIAIGDVYKGMGNNDAALDYYKKALVFDPKNISIKNNINYLEKLLR